MNPIIEMDEPFITDEIINDPLDKSIQNFQKQDTHQANYANVQDNILEICGGRLAKSGDVLSYFLRSSFP